MWIEVVAIGNELLSGHTLNENATYISSLLDGAGYSVSRQTVLSDESTLLKKGIQEILERTDLILTTGGLGPTLDDLSKKTVADLFGKKLVLDTKLQKELEERFPSIDPKNLVGQAMLPSEVEPIVNTLGTASGLIFQEGKKVLIMLPGVPREMQKMMEDVLVWIEKHFPLKEKTFSEALNFCLLTEGEVDPTLRELSCREVSLGIYPSAALLRVIMKTKAKDASSAEKKIKPIREKLTQKFAEYIYPSSHGKIEEAVHAKLLEEKTTLILGESCSGGALAERFTKQPNCSAYFLGSCVTYADVMKSSLLHVPEKILQEKGAVSRETVLSMLKGLFAISDAEYAVAISGIAGPSGGTAEKPVGTVYIGVQKRKEPADVGKIFRPGLRASIVEYSCNVALSVLWRKLSQNRRTFAV